MEFVFISRFLLQDNIQANAFMCNLKRGKGRRLFVAILLNTEIIFTLNALFT